MVIILLLDRELLGNTLRNSALSLPVLSLAGKYPGRTEAFNPQDAVALSNSQLSCEGTGSPPADGAPARFLLVATQKSGSWWTLERLGTHPDVKTAQGEPMKKAFGRDMPQRAEEWPLYRDVLEQTYAQLVAEAPSAKLVGMKLQYNQIPTELMPALLK